MVGELARYELLTTWMIDASAESAWEAIADFERWPSWWTSVQRVDRLEPGSFAIVWKSALAYEVGFTMRVTRSERPWLLEGSTEGELSGTGVCRVTENAGGATRLDYEWKVRTTRAWMNVLAPVARPVFKWSHDRVMQTGGQGLARLLDTRVSM
ncbi:MAG: SRPBCC family protein [Thermoleophilaceae bacterium]|nr:SRPBCC family protein [Thermoleophilaceae bacterium]